MIGLPLTGKRILITRAQAQAGKLQEKLEAAGAEVISIPAIEIIPPDSYAALDTALEQIVSYDWLVLTSANAVRAISQRPAYQSLAGRNLSSVSIAAIGRATAEAIGALGMAVDLVPPKAVAESLAEALVPRVKGKRVLIIRAKIARDVLPKALSAAGADVTIVEAYQTIIPSVSVEALKLALRKHINAVTFTSASSVSNFFALAEAAEIVVEERVKKISIGPITTQAITQLGWCVDAEAETANIESLVEATVEACQE